ncbi:hypothetical protein PVAP13_5NG555086 [Panicum virgatum]|uniref:Uncharacterized protein n=1 Tax=Panicum virgatum TaxID=38727 RepID=A0A8T0S3G4_PANVG|nr:hypothetical protein PVAP13_5NG555086 [Panicum virgatum]
MVKETSQRLPSKANQYTTSQSKNPRTRNAQCRITHTHLSLQEPLAKQEAATHQSPTAVPTGQENQLRKPTPGPGPSNPARGRGRPGNARPLGVGGIFKPREGTTVARRGIV